MHLHNIFILAITAATTPVLSSPVHGAFGSPRSLLSPRQQHNVQDDLKGKGRILLINTTDYSDANAKDKTIGCVNALGKAVPKSDSACAVFEFIDGNVGLRRDPSKIASPLGSNCTFHNIRQPTNVDSYYGKDSFAFYCGKTALEDTSGAHWLDGEGFWTVNGFKFPYIGTGNLAWVYYVRAPPQGRETSYDPSEIWVAYWGSHEMDGVPGQLMVLMMWDPVESV